MKFSKNIFIVQGACNVAFYNFYNNSIYVMEKNDYKQLDSILISNVMPTDERETITYLVEEKILVDDNINEQNLIPKADVKLDFAWIEITQVCNYKCIHCYEKDKESIYINLNEFEEIILFLKQLGINRVQITGGEPLMNPDILKILDLAGECFSYVELYTNGYFLTDDVIKVCRRWNINIAISQLGNTLQQYTNITRVADSFERYKLAMKRIEEGNVSYRLGTIEIGDNKLNGDMPRLVGNASLELYTDEMLIKKLITQKTFESKFISDFVVNAQIYNRCFAGQIYIDAKMRVLPCPMERSVTYGNVRDLIMQSILDNPIRYLNKDKVNGCAVCEYRYSCVDCRADRGKRGLYEKPWYCTYDPLNGTWSEISYFIKKIRKEGI